MPRSRGPWFRRRRGEMTRWIAMIALLLLASPLAAQDPMEARALEMTREQLQAVLERYEEAAGSTGYSRGIREQARREADLIRSRLSDGDFQVGDRIVLRVRGGQFISDTLVVEPGRVIRVTDIGEIPLSGVLRSELQEHLGTELARYIREPQVEAQSLIRVAIMGDVNRPGFMVLPASMLLEDALMAAGGPSREADLDDLRIERGGERIWSGAALQEALVEGRTLDQLNLRAGDRIEVPRQNPGFFRDGIMRTLLFTLPPVILLITRFL